MRYDQFKKRLLLPPGAAAPDIASGWASSDNPMTLMNSLPKARLLAEASCTTRSSLLPHS